MPEGTTPLFGKDNLPVDADTALGGHSWTEFRKTATTKALRIDGPFRVMTSESENEPFLCEDGWLAIDARGYPYAIADDEFQLIYAPAALAVPPDPIPNGWQGTPPAEGTRRKLILEAAKEWLLANLGKPVTSEEEAIEFADSIEEALLRAAEL